ncbi:MAG: methylenetetrahydrofolate reductase C-terminal domain-containing protein [Candidatus Verstraetearchaeota archaeon]|jgi:ferredoxin|nr:methylenetetrahydrofolate reductase C-terminal domain-containing protein [Candidatus Verstraetearchaeota archaeon]
MIITKTKSNLLDYVKKYNKIFVIGCGTCATKCQTGGEKEVEELVNKIKNMNKIAIGKVVESPCDLRVLKRDLMNYKNEINDAEVIVALCCGVGAQTISEFSNKEVIPGLDTLFIGMVERIGRFYEKCRACGNCILYETGGICPITNCPKRLLNGPCGGMRDRKCEVNDKDCTWVIIYERLKKYGREEDFKKIREAFDWSNISKSREFMR